MEATGPRRRSEKMSIAFLAPAREDLTAQMAHTSPLSSSSTSGGSRQGMLSHHDAALHASGYPPTPMTSPASTFKTGDEHDYDSINSSPSPPDTQSPVKAARTTKPRPPMPSYSEEQKFFIMFARIIQDKCWFDIETDFVAIFAQRSKTSKDGLTSVYYRIRKIWGLEDVLKSGASSFEAEKRVVDQRAENFSRDYLLAIGYLR